MPTLILTPRFTNDTQALWKAAGKLGWDVVRLPSWRIPEHIKSLPGPVLYGEALLGPMLAEQLGATLLNPPEDWLVRLPFEFKQRRIVLTTLGIAKTNPEVAFVKPPNDKSFPANVYKGSDLPDSYPDEMPVLVSEVVHWQSEFRCFILDRTLRTWSIYARSGELQHSNEYASTETENQQLTAFVTKMLADPQVDLPPATVVDVGVIAGRGWACVEQNAAWGAGIYGCDPEQVLAVLRNATLPNCTAE